MGCGVECGPGIYVCVCVCTALCEENGGFLSTCTSCLHSCPHNSNQVNRSSVDAGKSVQSHHPVSFYLLKKVRIHKAIENKDS